VPLRDSTLPLYMAPEHLGDLGAGEPREPDPRAEGIASQVTSVTLTTTDLPPPMAKEHVKRLTKVAAISGAVGVVIATAFLIIVTRKPWAQDTATKSSSDSLLAEHIERSSAGAHDAAPVATDTNIHSTSLQLEANAPATASPRAPQAQAPETQTPPIETVPTAVSASAPKPPVSTAPPRPTAPPSVGSSHTPAFPTSTAKPKATSNLPVLPAPTATSKPKR
jgi:hypothetical protein